MSTCGTNILGWHPCFVVCLNCNNECDSLPSLQIQVYSWIQICKSLKFERVAPFNKEEVLVGVFSVTVNLQTSRRFVYSSNPDPRWCPQCGGWPAAMRGPATRPCAPSGGRTSTPPCSPTTGAVQDTLHPSSLT